MWLQELLSTDTHALGQRMSSNRISAADNEYTEGQVMLTGAKLCELIGPRSMAKRPSRQRPGPTRAASPPRAALGGPALSGEEAGPYGRPILCLWRPSQPPPRRRFHTRFGPPGPRLASRLLEEHGCSACSTKAL